MLKGCRNLIILDEFYDLKVVRIAFPQFLLICQMCPLVWQVRPVKGVPEFHPHFDYYEYIYHYFVIDETIFLRLFVY